MHVWLDHVDFRHVFGSLREYMFLWWLFNMLFDLFLPQQTNKKKVLSMLSLYKEEHLNDTKKFLGQAFLGRDNFWKSTDADPVTLPEVRSVSLQA